MNQPMQSTKIAAPPQRAVLVLEEHRKRSRARITIALMVALFGATTAAAITASSNRSCSSVPKLWLQTPPSILKLPGAYGTDEMLF
jgi:hypothetical protein